MGRTINQPNRNAVSTLIINKKSDESAIDRILVETSQFAGAVITPKRSSLEVTQEFIQIVPLLLGAARSKQKWTDEQQTEKRSF